MRLARAFLAATDGVSAEQITKLEVALRLLVDEARAALPSLPLPEETFCAHLGALGGHDPAARWNSTHAADLWLACACTHGVPGAAERFEVQCKEAIDRVLQRMTIRGDQAGEVKQRLRARLLVGEDGQPPRVAGYTGRGDLAAWARIAATRVALNLLRAEPGPSSDDALLHRLPAGDDDPELRMLKARYALPFRVALKAALGALDARARLLLKQHYVDGLSTEELGGRYRVHRVTVLRWLADARQRVSDETERLLGRELGVDAEELDSLARLVRSQIDFSLHDCLRVH